MSGNDGNDVQRIKVSFESGFNKSVLAPYDAYVRYGDTCHVIRCTSARNGSLLVYGSYAVAACVDKDRIKSGPVLSENIRCERRLKHAGVELNYLGKEVCMNMHINASSYIFIYD